MECTGGIDDLLKALLSVPPGLNFSSDSSGTLPPRSRARSVVCAPEVIPDVDSSAAGFFLERTPAKFTPLELPHPGSCERLMAGMAALSAPSFSNQLLGQTVPAPPPSSELVGAPASGLQDRTARPPLPEAGECVDTITEWSTAKYTAVPPPDQSADAITELLTALLSCPPPIDTTAGCDNSAGAASVFEQLADGEEFDHPLDDHDEEGGQGVATIAVDPLSWANAQRVQWTSADEYVNLGDNICHPYEKSSFPEKSEFTKLWTQTGYPFGWASMTQSTARILASVHDQWPLYAREPSIRGVGWAV